MKGTDYDALAALLGAGATREHPLGPLTTYGVGGPAALFVEIDDLGTLDTLRGALAGSDVAVFVIGRGSNLLVADAGYDGIVVHLGPSFSDISLPDASAPGEAPSVVRAGAAAPLPVLARRAADAGWCGLTWAVGVPGSVGGGVRMNAGGHGADMASCLRRYHWVDLRRDAGGSDDVHRLAYGYRRSSITASQLVLSAEFDVTAGDADSERAALASIVHWRREHQPGGSNAGSVFTNPVGDAAGRLVEEAGLKGFRIGTAHVSEKHANFIQADPGGRADDVRAVMEHVRTEVRTRCGIELSTEVRLLGFADGDNGGVDAASGPEGRPSP